MNARGAKARIGVVGVGWWACVNHIPALQTSDDADCVAICDLDPARLVQVGDQFGIAGRYTDVAQMVEAERLDGVIVATPHVAHRLPAVAALQAGAHVMVEKPMATTGADARAILAAALAAGREVMVPTGYSFTRFTATATDMVRAGRIGTVRHAICSMSSALEDLMAGEPMLETADHVFRPPPSTWADPARAGGYGWGQLSHALGWLIHVADLEFAEVACMDGKSRTGVDYYDAAIARATNGATISISGSSTMPKHRGLHFEVRLFGTEGMLHLVAEAGIARLVLSCSNGNDESPTITAEEIGYDGMLPVRAFVALCNGLCVQNPANATVGLRVTEALEAMYRAAISGRFEKVGA
jgi:predicted dehydrogenase